MVELFLDKTIQDKLYHFHNLGKAKTIVLLNGLFASYQSWDAMLPELLKNYNVLQLNFIGQGVLSCRSLQEVDIKNHAEQLNQLLNDLDISEFEMVGISHGARVGLYFVSHYQHKITRFIAANSYLNPDTHLEAKLYSWLTANRIGGGTHRFDVALPWVWGRTFVEENTELINYYREKADSIDSALSHQLIYQAIQPVDFNLKNFAGELIVASSKEDLLTPEFYQNEILREATNSKHIWIKGGHASLIEYPMQLPVLLTALSNKEVFSVV